MSNELLKTVPGNLRFHSKSNKQISCSVHLINKTNNHVASEVKLRSQRKSVVRPNAVSGAHIMKVTPRMFCKEARHHRVYKTRLGVAPPVQGGSEDDFGCVREPKAPEFLHMVIGGFLEILLLCSPPALLLFFTMYYHLLLSHVEAHASSAKAPVPDYDNYPHLFDMLPVVSFTTKGINLPQFQVFINFRGDELRNTFVGFLVKAMRLEKINVFTDEVEVRGTSLNSLFSRIEASKVAVAILSERYTESSWCLDELVRMKEQMEQGKLVVVPVFYKLDPSACAYLDGTFGDKFRRLEWEYRSEPHRIKKWKDALSSVSKIMGLKLDPGSDESKFVDLIVEEVKKVLIKNFTDNEIATDSIIGVNKTFKEERNPSF